MTVVPADAQTDAAADDAPVAPGHAIIITLIVASSFLMQSLDMTIITTSLPAMSRSLDVPALSIHLAVTSYILSLVVFMPMSGWLAERFGAQRVFCVSLAIFTAGSIFCGIGDSLWTLTGARVVQGFGGAVGTTVGRLIVLRAFPKRELVRAMTYLALPVMVGPLAGPLVGGFITTYFSWRWIFLVNVPVGIVGIILALWFIPKDRAFARPTFDGRGFLVAGIGFVAFQCAVENLGGQYLPWSLSLVLFTIAAVMAWIYLRHARGRSNPALATDLFRIRPFRIGVISGGLCRIGFNAATFLLPLLFQFGFGLSALNSGALTVFSSIGQMIARPFISRVLRRIGFRWMLTGNAMLGAIVTAGFSLLTPTTPYWILLTYIFVFGGFRAVQFNASHALIFSDIPREELGQSVSLSGIFQQLSMGLGVTVSVVILSMIAGSTATPTLDDFRYVFVIVALIPVLSVFQLQSLQATDAMEASGHR